MARDLVCERCQETFTEETPNSLIGCPRCGGLLRRAAAAATPVEPADLSDAELPLSHEDPVIMDSGRGGMENVTDAELAKRPGEATGDACRSTSRSHPFSDSAFTIGEYSGVQENRVNADSLAGTSAAESAAIVNSIAPGILSTPGAGKESRQATRTRQSRLALLLVIVGTYASLLTLYVIFLSLTNRTHQLESLPDLRTAQQLGGRISVPLPENRLPPGHELRLGQSQRFGEIRVTPLRVTRGPLQFRHFTGDTTLVRSPSEPVLKLWLKFENVSEQSSIIPIDSTLMYFQREAEPKVAFNVIFPLAERKDRNGIRYYHYDQLSSESEWQVIGQATTPELQPHEVMETFVPSQEGIDDLSGQIVWRVHFRKGYGPETGNGVTTLIDVVFRDDEIVQDEA